MIKIILFWVFSFSTFASTIIGTDTYVNVKHKQSLVDIAKHHQIGQKQIQWANPDISRWSPKPKTKILIPGKHILPNYNKDGIIINLAEYRLYHFKDGEVNTYPVSIGRRNWKTPQGVTRIIQRIKDPSWTPPESIRKERIAKGKKPYPRVIPPGPNNPLGLFALRLGMPGYLIHGTNKTNGLGMAVSHGCIRMYGKDIKTLYYNTLVNDPVTIINEPIKVGTLDNNWYVQVYPNKIKIETNIEKVLSMIPDDNVVNNIDRKAVISALRKKSGMPTMIYKNVNTTFTNNVIKKIPKLKKESML